MPFFRPLILILLSALLLLSWWRWQGQPGELRRVRLVMGTTVEILASHPDDALLDEAVSAAFAEIERLDRLLSSYRPESDVSRLSHSSQPLSVSPETSAVLALGLEIASASDGAFDLGLGRLKRAWGLDGDSPGIPDQEEIREAIRGLGPAALRLESDRVIKVEPDMVVDLGGVGKGYAVDRAAEILRGYGISSAAINAGGDMFLLGRRQQRPWRIGIQHPRQQETTLATVQVEDLAVVTSGDYERFFEENGQRYHHLFDPATGYPAWRSQSVTVVAKTVALADALATAAFVLGPEEGLRLLSSYPGAAMLVVGADGQVHTTPGWQILVAEQ